MKALLAVCSEKSTHPLETVLVNGSRIRQLYCSNLQIVVEKVRVKLERGCEWDLYIEERRVKTYLLNEKDVKECDKKVDLLEILGHPLILFCYQNLANLA